jgi:hypothetical protein
MNAKAIRDRFERETGDRLTIHKVRGRDIPSFDTLDAGKLEGATRPVLDRSLPRCGPSAA